MLGLLSSFLYHWTIKHIWRGRTRPARPVTENWLWFFSLISRSWTPAPLVVPSHGNPLLTFSIVVFLTRLTTYFLLSDSDYRISIASKFASICPFLLPPVLSSMRASFFWSTPSPLCFLSFLYFYPLVFPINVQLLLRRSRAFYFIVSPFFLLPLPLGKFSTIEFTFFFFLFL